MSETKARITLRQLLHPALNYLIMPKHTGLCYIVIHEQISSASLLRMYADFKSGLEDLDIAMILRSHLIPS
jgi:hypothetical protein